MTAAVMLSFKSTSLSVWGVGPMSLSTARGSVSPHFIPVFHSFSISFCSHTGALTGSARALSTLGPGGPSAEESLFVLKAFSGQVSWWSLGAGDFHVHTRSLFLTHVTLTGPYCEPGSISHVTWFALVHFLLKYGIRSPFNCSEAQMLSSRSQRLRFPAAAGQQLWVSVLLLDLDLKGLGWETPRTKQT